MYTHSDGQLASNEQERIALEHQGFVKCRNIYCNFMIGPHVLDELDSEAMGSPDASYRCPHCGLTQQPLKLKRPEIDPGGMSSSGLTNTDMGQIGEDLVEQLGYLGPFGHIQWWHKGGSSQPSALDGATERWGVECKTVNKAAARTRAMIRPSDKPSKAEAVNNFPSMAAQASSDPVLQKFVATNPDILGLLAVVIVLDFETNTADIFGWPFPKDPATKLLDPNSLKHINYTWKGIVTLGRGIPFQTTLPNPQEQGFVPFSERKQELPEVFSKTADFGWGGDSHPAEEPQAREDRQHVNDSYGQESSEHDTVSIDYNFVWANGELDVSGQHDHKELLDRNNVPSTHTGPMAVGNVTVEDGVAIWEVVGNAGGQALAKVLKKYTQQAGWDWGGIVDKKSGHPFGDGERVSHMYFTYYDGVKLSTKPLGSGQAGRIDIFNHRVARVRWHPETKTRGLLLEGLQEWADDFGVKLAEYPGGSNMNDQLKNHSPMGEDLEIHNLGDPDWQPDKDRDRTPIGVFKCPDCGVLRHRWNEYLLHRKTHEPQGPTVESENGHFPEINDGNYIEMRQEPGIHTGAKDPKDMFDQPVPFMYDIDEDKIHVGAPGERHSEIKIPMKYSPGGLVQGEYQPGGKVLINTVTSMPYSIRHLIGLWYYQHPEFEVTSVEVTKPDGKTHKVAGRDVGGYVATLAASDPAVHNAWQALRKAGGKVYVVGGAIRDALMHKTPKDIDLMVTGLPADQVHEVLSALPGRMDITGKDFGVFRYNFGENEVEVAMPRTEKSTGARRVDFDVQVDHNLPVETDLERRDFTANAIALDLDSGRLVDPFDGAGDIEKGILKTVHPNSFIEDPTRIVRGLVAHARHGLNPDETTRAQMESHAHALRSEAPERIQAELDKLMKTDNPAKAIRLAQETGVLRHFLPEVDRAFGFDQKNPHHQYDLGTHLLNVLEHTANQTQDPDVRMAALLHDIGKPDSQWINPETGQGHYYRNHELGLGQDHETVGAEMASKRLKALKYPNRRIERVHHLIANHMFPDFSSDRGARKFIQRVGPEHADDLFVLRAADRAGKGTDDYQSMKTPVGQQKALVQEALERRAPTNTSDLAINGNDLLGIGVQKGPLMGQILKQLTDLVVENPELNQRETLLNYVRHELVSQ